MDEAHRSIFRKYKAIYDYFDAYMVGLTATPADEVDRNTYIFFEVQRGVPTFVYEYATAVGQDHVLVPYLGIATHTDFLDEGITYDELSDDDKERLEEDYAEEGEPVPDYIPQTDIDTLVKAPFDRLQSFVRLFDRRRQMRLVSIIRTVRDNAVKPAA